MCASCCLPACSSCSSSCSCSSCCRPSPPVTLLARSQCCCRGSPGRGAPGARAAASSQGGAAGRPGQPEQGAAHPCHCGPPAARHSRGRSSSPATACQPAAAAPGRGCLGLPHCCAPPAGSSAERHAPWGLLPGLWPSAPAHHPGLGSRPALQWQRQRGSPQRCCCCHALAGHPRRQHCGRVDWGQGAAPGKGPCCHSHCHCHSHWRPPAHLRALRPQRPHHQPGLLPSWRRGAGWHAGWQCVPVGPGGARLAAPHTAGPGDAATPGGCTASCLCPALPHWAQRALLHSCWRAGGGQQQRGQWGQHCQCAAPVAGCSSSQGVLGRGGEGGRQCRQQGWGQCRGGRPEWQRHFQAPLTAPRQWPRDSAAHAHILFYHCNHCCCWRWRLWQPCCLASSALLHPGSSWRCLGRWRPPWHPPRLSAL